MTATERPSLEARARGWCDEYRLTSLPQSPRTLTALLESVAAEERAYADTRLQTAVVTMEQATQAMLEAQAEVVELRAALERIARMPIQHGTALDNQMRDMATAALARPQPEAILRVLRAAQRCADATARATYYDAADDVCAAVRALPEGVREVLK